jgi:hypothetical protein
LNPATATCKTCSSLTYPPATLLTLHEMEVSKGVQRTSPPDQTRRTQRIAGGTRFLLHWVGDVQSPSYLAEEGRRAETAQDSRATGRGLCTDCVICDQTRCPGNVLGSLHRDRRGATRSAVAAITMAGLNRHAASSFVLETLVNMTIGINSIKQTAAQSLWRPRTPTDQPGEARRAASEGIYPCPLTTKLPVRIAAERHSSAPSRPPPVSLRNIFAFPAHSCFVLSPLPQGEPSTHRRIIPWYTNNPKPRHHISH